MCVKFIIINIRVRLLPNKLRNKISSSQLSPSPYTIHSNIPTFIESPESLPESYIITFLGYLEH